MYAIVEVPVMTPFDSESMPNKRWQGLYPIVDTVWFKIKNLKTKQLSLGAYTTREAAERQLAKMK